MNQEKRGEQLSLNALSSFAVELGSLQFQVPGKFLLCFPAVGEVWLSAVTTACFPTLSTLWKNRFLFLHLKKYRWENAIDINSSDILEAWEVYAQLS